MIGEALTTAKPKARYLAGKGAREAVALARTPSDRIKDLAIAKDVGLPSPSRRIRRARPVVGQAAPVGCTEGLIGDRLGESLRLRLESGLEVGRRQAQQLVEVR